MTRSSHTLLCSAALLLLTAPLTTLAQTAPATPAAPAAAPAPKPNLPNVVILATGGTIASSAASSTQVVNYSLSQTVNNLINAVPAVNDVANVTGEQVADTGSQDMTPEILLTLAKRINVLLASPDVSGVIVTHGTDTMEETAYFLNLVVKSDKPVVIVGSMRPSSALSADGPFNLYEAVQLAADPNARGKGVMVLLNDRIGAARFITKTNTTALDTFKSAEQGYLGAFVGGKAYFYNQPVQVHTKDSEFDVTNLTSLPPVEIVYGYQSNGGAMYDAAVAAGDKGIVVAGTGDGTISTASKPSIASAVAKGVVIARSTRTGSGTVAPAPDDLKNGYVSANSLNPQKARILLMLALTKTKDLNKIQDYFNRY
ncbi:asparaginase [Deinococcus sp. AJ005]|uniref:asparaginase n=1 Tax=Deinococcus sp. AJ005 TaxID=2652443 RepID=UPI00125CD203|nr:asparaginase [Deinococcus sp. AJ005]QFP77699.1 asparaginase [Deinococcus sp. AJ005]